MAVAPEVRLEDGDHVVHFYEADDVLVRAVVGSLSGALTDGDSVVMIVRREHRAAFETALRTAGVDVDAERANRRLFLEDASETLSRFLVDGLPEPGAFDAVVGDLVRLASEAGPVRAYGEMVALLWEAGAVPAAIELEKLWNALAERVPLSLFCAYAAPSMVGEHEADGFSTVCELHSRVVGGAPVADGAEHLRRFAKAPQSPRLARRFVADTLQSWGLDRLFDDVAVVVAELCANAVVHAGSDFTVALARRGAGIRVAVGDASTAAPTPRRPLSTRPGGRGLMLVGKLSTDWGHLPAPGGKVVWADVGVAGRRAAP